MIDVGAGVRLSAFGLFGIFSLQLCQHASENGHTKCRMLHAACVLGCFGVLDCFPWSLLITPSCGGCVGLSKTTNNNMRPSFTIETSLTPVVVFFEGAISDEEPW